MEKQPPHSTPGLDVETFASHEVRLSARQWLVVGIAAALTLLLMPRVWPALEPFEPGPDYRIPYELSEDYWHFERYVGRAVSEGKTVVLGDSVVWGQYVAPDQTLTHYLNELAGEDRYVNAGVDGMHPAALAGLVRHYGGPIRNTSVVVHFNPLWMSSKRRDLQTTKEFRFNHPRLVPQFRPRIPCYRETYTNRVGIAVERALESFAWADHLRIAYFGQQDMPAWTIEHPYANPVGPLLAGPAVTGAGQARYEPVPWEERGLTAQDFQWVFPDDSLQWALFLDALATLRKRGNTVSVIVGPMNEHMVTDESRRRYRELVALLGRDVSSAGGRVETPPLLPSRLYADVSHPLAEGYRAVALQFAGSGRVGDDGG